MSRIKKIKYRPLTDTEKDLIKKDNDSLIDMFFTESIPEETVIDVSEQEN